MILSLSLRRPIVLGWLQNKRARKESERDTSNNNNNTHSTRRGTKSGTEIYIKKRGKYPRNKEKKNLLKWTPKERRREERKKFLSSDETDLWRRKDPNFSFKAKENHWIQVRKHAQEWQRRRCRQTRQRGKDGHPAVHQPDTDHWSGPLWWVFFFFFGFKSGVLSSCRCKGSLSISMKNLLHLICFRYLSIHQEMHLVLFREKVTHKIAHKRRRIVRWAWPWYFSNYFESDKIVERTWKNTQ